MSTLRHKPLHRVTMWSKTSLEEGPISQKLRENLFFTGPDTSGLLHCTSFLLNRFYVGLLRIWRVLYHAYERITNYIGSKFEMWLLIYTARQNTHSNFHRPWYRGGGGYSSMIWVGTCRWDLKSKPIFIPNFAEKWDPFLYQTFFFHKF